MKATVVAIVDAGPLYAAADENDRDHERCLRVLASAFVRPVYPAMAIAEATYFVGRRLGAEAEARFLRAFSDLHVECPTPGDFERMAELVRRYAGFPLGGTDASVIALAERLKTDTIVTLDRRHFGSVKPAHCESFRILPEG